MQAQLLDEVQACRLPCTAINACAWFRNDKEYPTSSHDPKLSIPYSWCPPLLGDLHAYAGFLKLYLSLCIGIRPQEPRQPWVLNLLLPLKSSQSSKIRQFPISAIVAVNAPIRFLCRSSCLTAHLIFWWDSLLSNDRYALSCEVAYKNCQNRDVCSWSSE